MKPPDFDLIVKKSKRINYKHQSTLCFCLIGFGILILLLWPAWIKLPRDTAFNSSAIMVWGFFCIMLGMARLQIVRLYQIVGMLSEKEGVNPE